MSGEGLNTARVTECPGAARAIEHRLPAVSRETIGVVPDRLAILVEVARTDPVTPRRGERHPAEEDQERAAQTHGPIVPLLLTPVSVEIAEAMVGVDEDAGAEGEFGMRAETSAMCSLAVGLAFTVMLGCSEERTEILVVVDTDLVIPAELTSVEIEVVGGSPSVATASFEEDDARPAVLKILHTGGTTGDMVVTARGLRGRTEVISRTASGVRFAVGEQRMLRLDLLRDCLGVECGATETCLEGVCADSSIDPSALPLWSSRPDPLDPMAGLDASVDAGMDAGTDAGPPDAGPECMEHLDCDDGIDCTEDRCVANECQLTPNDTLCIGDTHECTVEACVLDVGCMVTPTDSLCPDDGIPCTVETCDMTDGCMRATDDAMCDDGVGCTTDRCDMTLGCAAPTANHAACLAGRHCDATADCTVGPTFSDIYSAIIMPSCGGAAAGECHYEPDPMLRPSGLDFTAQAVAYASLMSGGGVPSVCDVGVQRVVPRDARASMFWRKVSFEAGLECGSRMPYARTVLDSTLQNMIRDWINSGALDN